MLLINNILTYLLSYYNGFLIENYFINLINTLKFKDSFLVWFNNKK